MQVPVVFLHFKTLCYGPRCLSKPGGGAKSGAPGPTEARFTYTAQRAVCRNKKLLEAKGIATRNKGPY